MAPAVLVASRGPNHEGIYFMAKDSLACLAYPDLEEDCHGDLEHIGEMAVRVMLPTTTLRPCMGCGGQFLGRDFYELMGWHESLTFFERDALLLRLRPGPRRPVKISGGSPR